MNRAAAPILTNVHDLTPARLRALQQEAAHRAGLAATFRDTLGDGQPGPELAVIPAGLFEMGTAAADRDFGDQPRRPVRVERSFALGRYCVTAAEFEAFAQDTGHAWAAHLVRAEGRQPAININRGEAAAYLAWLSHKTGQRYRLPSEAEWEYAARAGSSTHYCFGDELGCGEANTGSFQLASRSSHGWRRFLPFCAPLNRAVEVGFYPANLWGLFDVHGNVWEFTSDPWVGPIDALHSAGTGRDGKWFVTKGGSWFESVWQARSAARKPRMWDELDVNLGFRVLREIP